MQLAGEAGALLRIEKDIAEKIKDEYRDWGKMFQLEQGARWRSTVEQVQKALHDYSRKAANGRSFQKRLFANDAARGFAFIDLCWQKYDVVLMNPPFGKVGLQTNAYISESIPAGKNDVYAAMIVQQCGRLSSETSRVGALTSRAFVVGRDLTAFRLFLLDSNQPKIGLFVDLGRGVLDAAMVETAAFVICRKNSSQIAYCDLRQVDRRQVQEFMRMAKGDVWRVRSGAIFQKVEGAPLLLEMASDELGMMLHGPRLSPRFARITKGLSTEDDFRFIRISCEIDIVTKGAVWQSFAKGGGYSWFTSDTRLVINRASNGEELEAYVAGNSGNTARARQSSKYYGFSALTHSERSQKGFSCRRLRAGSCFSGKSGVILPEEQKASWLRSIPILLASERYITLIESQAKFGSYEIGLLKKLPAPNPEWLTIEAFANRIFLLVDQAMQLVEVSGLFVRPTDFKTVNSLWSQALDNVEEALTSIGVASQ